VQKSRDPQEVRRALAILRLSEGKGPAEVSRLLSAARSSVYRWRSWFKDYGTDGLKSLPRGRSQRTVSEPVIDLLRELVRKPPHVFKYLRTRWSSELLAREVHRQLGVTMHPSTVRRLLPRIGIRWRRARPGLFKRDPRKAERLAAIYSALKSRHRHEAVFFADEVDIDLNPKIGFGWMGKGRQEAVPTPGTNEKCYLAGALHAQTGRVVWVEGPKKRSELFIALLRELKRRYRGCRRIILIVDNYIIHKSHETRAFLEANPKFELLFQPTYHPWVNRIERLWKALHDTVTRNHHWKTMEELMKAVRSFMTAAQPFPGSGHGTARMHAS